MNGALHISSDKMRDQATEKVRVKTSAGGGKDGSAGRTRVLRIERKFAGIDVDRHGKDELKRKKSNRKKSDEKPEDEV